MPGSSTTRSVRRRAPFQPGRNFAVSRDGNQVHAVEDTGIAQVDYHLAREVDASVTIGVERVHEPLGDRELWDVRRQFACHRR